MHHGKRIEQCLELAKQGEGKVSPNPLVGAVILDAEGNEVGKGYHECYGEAHAEINALNMAGDKAKEGTLYINLEPCCHWGKTPPCIDRVISSGVKTLVLGMTDPNPKVAGKSVKMAKEAGINVIEGILSKKCLKLNEIFIKNVTQQKPFVAIKTACTMDGKIATRRGQSKWITSENARREVHRLRNKYDAILTGSGTVLTDNPSLTCRMSGGRNPVRVVIDRRGVIPPDAKIYQEDGTRVIKVTSGSLRELFDRLYAENIYSVLVEAGAGLNGAILREKLFDKVYFFFAPLLMGDKNALSSFEGLDVPDLENCTKLEFSEMKDFSPDIMIEGYLK